MISKYDRPEFNKNTQTVVPDGMLSADEIRIPAEKLRNYDQDHNGSLDILELRHYWQNPVSEWQVEVQMGVQLSLKLVAGPTPIQQANVAASRLNRNLIVLGPPIPSWPPDLDAFVRERFMQLDRDKNEYLERREVAVLEKQMPFAVFDRDGDMRVYLREFADVIADQLALARSRITVNLRGTQHGLFEMIDANADQKISIAEIKRLAELIPAVDLDQDHAISPSELPHTWMLTVDSPLNLTSIAVDTSPRTNPNPTSNRGANRETNSIVESRIPRWFQYMDRNRDQLVTRLEFLGALADFERLDANSDGSLDGGEVATLARYPTNE
jgi:Ca2+-binding EF-hand superfamily protein